jgi:hypothetical protein
MLFLVPAKRILKVAVFNHPCMRNDLETFNVTNEYRLLSSF